jgi:AmiR/NasT family two-component response regulator
VEALQTRQRIGEAVGIVMHQFTIDEQAAFGYLVRVSRGSDMTVEDVAVRIIGQVTQHPAMPPAAVGRNDWCTTAGPAA